MVGVICQICYHFVIILLSFCYHFVIICDSPKIGVSCFREKGFAVFRGCNQPGGKMFVVPKSGFLVSGKKVLPFSGGATNPGVKCL